jgi:hypothetical protein
MKYILSYVNVYDITLNFNKTFETFTKLEDYVMFFHPNFTSYQIIVVKE